MKRLSKTILFSLVGLGLVGGGVSEVQACKRSFGGGGWGHSFYRSAPVYYPQPVYVQPQVYPQPVQQPIQQAPLNGQPAGVNPQGSPLGQPGGIAQQGQIQQGQPGGLTQQGQPGGLTQQGQAGGLPQQGQPAQGGQTDNNAQMTALQLLADFTGDSQAPAPSAEQTQGLGFSGVGNWTATLSNGAVVQLNLQANGSFMWLANANGKQSTFQGTYTLTGDSLTLIRSTDNQRLAGSMSITGDNAFTFKLNGTQDAGLLFARR